MGFYISPHLMFSITFVSVMHFHNNFCISITTKIIKEIFSGIFSQLVQFTTISSDFQLFCAICSDYLQFTAISSRSQPFPVIYSQISKLHHIPAYSRLFQHIQFYSSIFHFHPHPQHSCIIPGTLYEYVFSYQKTLTK